MKVEFFVDTYRPYISGVVTAVDMMASNLTSRGHSITINAPSYPDAPGDEDPNIRRIPSIPFPGYEGLRIAAPLPFHLSTKEPFDLVHAHSPFPMGLAALSLARDRKVPMVYTCHSLYPDYSEYVPWASTTVRRVLEAHLQYFCNRCDAVIAPSEHVRRRLLEWGVSRPIHVAPTGIELAPFQSIEHEDARQWLLRRHHIPEQRFVLLFVGRLAQEKNLEHLINELMHLQELNAAQEAPGVHLIMLGAGPHEEVLRQLVSRYGLKNHVTFAGTVDRSRVVRYYRGADAFAFPSMAETQGIVLIEALAGGLPVVALSAPATREVVRNGVEGILVSGADGALANSLNQLIASPNLQDLLRQAALRRAQDFSVQNMVTRLEELYADILTNYQSPGAGGTPNGQAATYRSSRAVQSRPSN